MSVRVIGCELLHISAVGGYCNKQVTFSTIHCFLSRGCNNLQLFLNILSISSEKITEELINELADKNWKVRGEALQKVTNILSDAKFVLPNMGPLPEALKARLGESNKNLVRYWKSGYDLFIYFFF